MISLLRQHHDSIAQLCHRYGVARLEVFGSASDGTEFDPARSDVDLLVEFKQPPGNNFDAYFDLKFALEKLLNRPVDLVEEGAATNPYFLRRLNESRQPLYGT